MSGASRPDALLAYQRALIARLRALPLAIPSDRSDVAPLFADLYVAGVVLAHTSSLHAPATSTNPSVPATLPSIIGAPGARILLAGPAASGKSVELQRLALGCAASRVGAPEGALMSEWHGPAPLPILANLRDLAALLRAEGASAIPLWNGIKQLLQRDGHGACVPEIQPLLESGDILLLLDGLDDVPRGASYRAVVAAIEQFVARYPGNRYLVTCREPTTALAGFASFTLQPLGERQIDDLAARWCRILMQSHSQFQHELAEDQIAILQGRLRLDDGLWGLAHIPIVVALCALAHIEGAPLPAARGTIYAQLLDLLLDRWEQTRSPAGAPLARALGIPSLDTPDRRLALLEPLALALQSRQTPPAGLPRAEAEALLRQALARHGVSGQHGPAPLAARLLRRCRAVGLVARAGAPQVYTMPYAPLRHYLAARALARMPDLAARARQLCADPAWHAPLALIAQELERIMGVAAANTFARHLIEHNTLLAAECLRDLDALGGIEAPLRAQAQQRLLDLLSLRAYPLAGRIRAGTLLGDLRDPRFDDLLPPLARVEGGRFILGANLEGYADEGPAQWVDLPTFAIGVYLVTNREYARFLEQHPGAPSPRYWHDPRFNNPSQPVVGITWHEAVAYLVWLTLQLTRAGRLPNGQVARLPTEIEWEKAASWDAERRHKRRYPWGEEWDAARANTAERRGAWATSPVGCYPHGVSPYGVHDLIGNVWEWTTSEYASYPGAPVPFHESGTYVLRGLSCATQPTHARCTFRSHLPASYWRFHLGFRLVIGRPTT